MLDDIAERKSSLITFNTIFPYTCSAKEQNEACPDNTDLYTFYDRNYGTFLQQPMVLIEYLHHYQLDLQKVFQLRHLWVFLNVFAAEIFLFFLLKRRFKSMWAGVFGVLIFIFSPRLFGNSFYNIKDLLCYAWFLIEIYFLYRLLEKPSWQHALGMGIVSAIAVNTRIISAIVPALAVLLLLMNIVTGKQPARKMILCILTLGIPAVALWILISPASWHTPFQFMLDSLREFSDFKRQENMIELYIGQFYTAKELPWHYLPVWILISTPAVILVISIIGFIKMLIQSFKKDFSPEKQIDSVILITLVMLYAYILIRRPVLYDGWRHLYFLYGPIQYCCVYGFESLRKKKSKISRCVLYAFCMASFIASGIWMVKNHPYEGTYFNPVVRKFSVYLFVKDYWRLSTKEILDYIVKDTPEGPLHLWADGAKYSCTLYDLNKADRDRITDSDYGYGGPADYIVVNDIFSAMDIQIFPYYDDVYDVMMDGVKLASVFKRQCTDEIRNTSGIIKEIKTDIHPELTRLITDGDNWNTGWSTERPQQAGDSIDFILNGTYTLSGFSLFSGKKKPEQLMSFPHYLSVAYSQDGGKTWTETNLSWSGITDFKFTPVQANALRLHLTEGDENPWALNGIYFYGQKIK